MVNCNTGSICFFFRGYIEYAGAVPREWVSSIIVSAPGIYCFSIDNRVYLQSLYKGDRLIVN